MEERRLRLQEEANRWAAFDPWARWTFIMLNCTWSVMSFAYYVSSSFKPFNAQFSIILMFISVHEIALLQAVCNLWGHYTWGTRAASSVCKCAWIWAWSCKYIYIVVLIGFRHFMCLCASVCQYQDLVSISFTLVLMDSVTLCERLFAPSENISVKLNTVYFNVVFNK